MVIAIGIDLVDVERVARMLQRDRERCAARLLTVAEWDYCAPMRDPAPHVAARLAAKEATFKALAGSAGARAIGWREIEVVHDDFRRPTLVLHGRAAVRAADLAVVRRHLSITHSHTAAGAMVVLEGSP